MVNCDGDGDGDGDDNGNSNGCNADGDDNDGKGHEKIMVRMMIRMTDHICLLLALKNVALNKVTKQSSTYDERYSNYAVDGNEETSFKSCTHTDNSASPWWMVDLEQEVTGLNIFHNLHVGL